MKRRVRTGLETRGSMPPGWTSTEPGRCNPPKEPPEEYPRGRAPRGAETMRMVSPVVISGLDIFSPLASSWASDRDAEEDCAADAPCDDISVTVPLTACDGPPCARAPAASP